MTSMLSALTRQRKIIVVGGGIAGISCADELNTNCYKDIKVLEASERLGGRIYSFIWGSNSENENRHVELGTQRLSENSCFYSLAASLMDEEAPDYASALENFELVYGREECQAISLLRTFLSRQLIFPKDFNDIFKGEEFEELLKQNDSDSIKSQLEAVYKWWFGMSYEYATGHHRQVELKYGFGSLFRDLIRDMDLGVFHSRKEVIKIDWSAFMDESPLASSRAPQVKVTCGDGSLYEADHVVIAVPLGYLKENVDTLFFPALSEAKKNAIRTLDFVTVDKIFLEFEEPFWMESDVFHVIWNDSMDAHFKDHRHDGGQDPKEWIKCINRFEYVYSNRNVLCAWIWGEGAATMEILPREDVLCCCTKLLECLTKRSLPKPKKLKRFLSILGLIGIRTTFFVDLWFMILAVVQSPHPRALQSLFLIERTISRFWYLLGMLPVRYLLLKVLQILDIVLRQL